MLCIGDLMLDDFVYGEVSRISPEAPVPVLAVEREEIAIGGAGNVARNVAGLGARCIFLGVVGDDEAGQTLSAALAARCRPDRVESRRRSARPTMRKLRFVSEHHSTHLLRADWELAKPVSAHDRRRADRAHALAAPPRAHAVVLVRLRQGRADAAR